jgi:hypothetical protein
MSVLRRPAAALLLVLAFCGQPVPAYAEDRALIIGINAYPHFPKSQLTGSVNDARAMSRLAQEAWGFKSDQIRLLLDGQATSAAILDHIEGWLVAGTAPGDRVLFFYSGHGYYLFDPTQPPDERWRETIAPHDARPVGAGVANMIVDLEIKRRLDRLADRTVMFIADACHSGTLWRTLEELDPAKPSIVRSLAHVARERGVFRSAKPAAFDAAHNRGRFVAPSEHLIAWSAVQPTELAEEDMRLPAESRHGVFTKNFLEGLSARKADRNGDGRVSAMELYGYVSEKAGQYCAEQFCRSLRMTPMMEAPNRLVGLDLMSWRPPGESIPQTTTTAESAPRPSPTNVLPAANSAELRLELLPAPTLRVGDKLRLRLTSQREGWLIVLDRRDSGEVVQLFPSICVRPERRVRTGATVTLPDPSYGCEFPATKPGSGEILAVLSEDNVPLGDLIGRSRDLTAVTNGDDYLAEMAQRLMSAWMNDERTRPSRWSLVTARYTVSAGAKIPQ